MASLSLVVALALRDGRRHPIARADPLTTVVEYHGLGRRFLLPPRFCMRPQLNGGRLGGPMEEIRYAPSIPRLVGIVALLVMPIAVLAAFFAPDVPVLVVGVVGIAASVLHASRGHTVILGPDFIAAHGQRIRFKNIRPGERIQWFIGDVYASETARIGVSSIFLSRAQRSEIARRLASFQSS
jgi:hypothetical protein